MVFSAVKPELVFFLQQRGKFSGVRDSDVRIEDKRLERLGKSEALHCVWRARVARFTRNVRKNTADKIQKRVLPQDCLSHCDEKGHGDRIPVCEPDKSGKTVCHA